jgi:hypothetical protein
MPALPLLSILAILFSKEIFSYDSEKVVILCILSFILGIYFYTRKALSNIFIEHRNNLENDIISIYNLEIALLDKMVYFINNNKLVYHKIVNLSLWVNNIIRIFLFKINRSRILSILHVGKDYLNLYLREIILMNTFKSLFDTKLSDQKFSYLTKSILNDEISATNILTSSLNSIDEDIARNEDLLLLYNKDEVEIEYTLDSKNWYNFY